MYYFKAKTKDGYYYYFKSQYPVRNIKQSPIANTIIINRANIFEYYIGKYSEYKAKKSK